MTGYDMTQAVTSLRDVIAFWLCWALLDLFKYYSGMKLNDCDMYILALLCSCVV